MPRRAVYGPTRGTFALYFPLPAGTGAAEMVTDYVPGFEFVVEKVTVIVQIAGTGSGATRTLRVIKGASTVVATTDLALAETTPVGVKKALTVTAADARFGDADTLTVDVASGGTAFTAGAIMLLIQYRQHPQRVA